MKKLLFTLFSIRSYWIILISIFVFPFILWLVKDYSITYVVLVGLLILVFASPMLIVDIRGCSSLKITIVSLGCLICSLTYLYASGAIGLLIWGLSLAYSIIATKEQK